MIQQSGSGLGSIVVGLGFIGLIVTGLAGWFGALLALVNEFDYVGMGLCLAASAIAFGLLVNAVFRQ